MPKFPTGGKIRVSSTEPSPSLRKSPIESEIKYYGLVRDEALFDIQEPGKALSEVLKDVQDPAEAASEGVFSQQDIEIIDSVVRYNLKNEDFRVLLNASLDLEDKGSTTALVNPRQRVSDRIKQLESFAGRGTVYQGQGTTMFKYVVPLTAKDSLNKLYSHTNPPPFFTEAITSTAENAPDFIPTTNEQISRTHRVGYIENGVFIPSKESEWWWSGEYNRDAKERSEYGSPGRSSLTDPKFPIIKDGNISFERVRPEGIPEGDNWGLRFDTWMKRNSLRAFGRFVAQVNGHLRIDYFEKTGYSSDGAIQGTWRKALDTTDSTSYFMQNSVEEDAANSTYGFRRYFVQGGPSTEYGAGTGTAPDYAARGATGGVFDYSQTYNDREGNAISKFDNDYVPVVIRFWYGQQDSSQVTSNSTPAQVLASKPSGPPSMVFNFITADGYVNWNDYSSRVHFKRVSGEWVIQAETGNYDSTLSNFNAVFEVHAYKSGTTKPDGTGAYNPLNWNLLTTFVSGKRKDDTSTTIALFDIPGYSPQDGDDLWLVIRNRPFTAIPYTYTYDELWQLVLFDPDIRGRYETALDMLEGVGENYAEPDPNKISFQENYNYYKSKLGQLPALNTYGPDRYDGMIPISLTTAVGQRDYDYSHDKLLFIGRQRKSTSVKPLQTGEIRNPGENYTFFEVISDEFGNGGNVVISAYPANNMGILAAGSSGTFGRALNLADNTSTYSSSSRQNIQKLTVKRWPTNTNFDVSQAVKVRSGADSQMYLYITTGSGTTYNTYETTGIISQDLFGAGTSRNHDIKELFITGFKKSNGSGTGAEFYFYGLVGGVRESLRNVQVTTQPTDSTKIRDAVTFPNIIGVDSYDGTQIQFKTVADGSVVATAYVTSFDQSTNEVTYTVSSGTVTQNTSYFVDVWFNHIKLTKIPDRIVDSTGANQTASSHITDGSNIQIFYTHNGAYQYSRVDNGTGLSFSETLFFIGNDSDSSVTENRPFLDGTEVPAPPADIVTPFGYDNSVTDSDPGMGGLCYPPYRTQNTSLFSTALSTTSLESRTTGHFDVWWGSRDDLNTLGNKYLEVTNKLLFDFPASQRSTLLQQIASNDKPTFTSTTYTHKLEVELNVEVPTGPVANTHLYKDAQKYSNNKPVKDRYFLFIRRVGSELQVLSANNPSWV